MTDDQEPITESDEQQADAIKQAQLEQAEALRLEARRDGVKDIEREAKIDKLESAGDLVEATSLDAGKKEGPFVKDSWSTFDRPKITPAKLEPSWFKKSPAAQRRVLEKMMGTHRPTGGESRKRKPRDPFRPGTLKDRHESPEVRRRDAEADAILANTPAPKPSVPKPPPPEPIVGYCRHCHGQIPRNMRTDSKFCSDAHRVAFHRREKNREIFNAAFKDHRPGGLELPFYYHEPAPEPPPPMSATYAIESNQVRQYLAAMKRIRVTDNSVNM